MVLHHHVAQGTRPKMVHVGVMAAVILDSVFCSSVLLPTIDVRDPALKIKQKGHSETKPFLKFYFLFISFAGENLALLVRTCFMKAGTLKSTHIVFYIVHG